MKNIFKRSISCITTLIVLICSVTALSASAATNSSFTYDFKPKNTVYNTSTTSIYSEEVYFGRSSQEANVSLKFSINVPPKTSSFSVTVQGILQKKSGNTWVNVRTLNAGGAFSNSSTSSYKNIAKTASGYADLTKGSTYRVKYTITKNTTKTKYNLMPMYSMTFNLA